MDLISTVLLALVAAIVWVFKTQKDKRVLRTELQLEKVKVEVGDQRNRVRDAEIAKQGAKIGYEKAKKQFKKKYSKYLDDKPDVGSSK